MLTDINPIFGGERSVSVLQFPGEFLRFPQVQMNGSALAELACNDSSRYGSSQLIADNGFYLARSIFRRKARQAEMAACFRSDVERYALPAERFGKAAQMNIEYAHHIFFQYRRERYNFR